MTWKGVVNSLQHRFIVSATVRRMPDIRIGISGWTYGGWRGTFYPADLRQQDELAYASRQVNSIEINGSFYSLQRPESYARWYADTPDDFLFSVKGGRYITHLRKLHQIEAPLANFFASGILALGKKLGPILWQFPPIMRFNRPLFESFLKMLPRDTDQASWLAKQHSDWMEGRAYTRADGSRPLKHAIEVRNFSFATPEFVELLREQGVALVIADTAGKWPDFEDMTADFVYIRLHGEEELYVSGYDDASLDDWARKIRVWRSGRQPTDAKLIAPRSTKGVPRDIYVYFDNDVKVRAPFDAVALLERLTSFRPAKERSIQELSLRARKFRGPRQRIAS